MTGGVEIVLVRHGRTAWNAEGRFLGRSDIPLDTHGVAQAAAWARAGSWDDLAAVYASPLSRARQTAEALGRAVELHPGLRELEQGELEGLQPAEALARFPDFLRAWRADPVGVCVPGGESLDQVQARGLAALRDIAARHVAGQRVVVVSHQMLISSVCAALAGEPLARWRHHTVDHVAGRSLFAHGSGLTLAHAR